MYKPTKLTMINFMSHERSEVSFKQGATMIYGKNLTDEGQESNGSGKSAIIEAIALLLTGNTLRKVSSKDLVRNGEKECVLELTLIGDNDSIIIKRTIFSNTKSACLSIKINGENPQGLIINGENKVDVKDGNKWICNKLGISREDLLNFFIVSKEKYKSFLTSSDTDKKAIIDRFSQSDLVDPVFDILTSKKDKYEANIRDCEEEIQKCMGAIEVLQQQQQQDTVDHFVEQQKRNISNIKARIKEAEASKKLHDSNISEKLNEADVIEADIKNLPSYDDLEKKLVGINKDIDKKMTSYKETQASLTEANELIAEFKNSIAGEIECPDCEYRFVLGSDVDVKEVRADIKELAPIIVSLVDELGVKKKAGDLLRTNQEAITKEISAITDEARVLDRKLQSVINEAENEASSSSGMSIVIQRETEALEKEKNRTYEPDETKEQQIKERRENIKELEGYIESHKEGLVDTLEWTNYMKKFKAHLANKAVKAIEVMVNEYLGRMKTNLSLNIEGFKINKNGKIVEKITTHVLKDGMLAGLFEGLSTGEKARIEASVILALQGLINRNSTGLDLCFMDEVLDGLDSMGIRQTLRLLGGLNQTVMVITHGSLDQDVSQYIEVVKENGISKIS